MSPLHYDVYTEIHDHPELEGTITLSPLREGETRTTEVVARILRDEIGTALGRNVLVTSDPNDGKLYHVTESANGARILGTIIVFGPRPADCHRGSRVI